MTIVPKLPVYDYLLIKSCIVPEPSPTVEKFS